MKKFTKVISAIAVASALAATVCVAASAEKAGITFQMAGNYVFRDTIAQEKVIVYDQNYLNDSGEVGQYPDVEDDIYDLDGSFTDVDITGDGTYTVSVNQHATANMTGDSSIGYNMIKLATNIDTAKYPDLKITLNKVTIAGQELTPTTTVFSAADETLQCEKQSGKFDTTDLGFTDTDLVISLINTYGESVVDASLIDADGNITVEFTVEGMGAAAEEPAESETPAEPEAPTTGDSSKPSTNTGAEGIALAAGVAVLATGAAIVAKKRK